MNTVPVSDVPITVEKRGFYETERVYARYGDGTLIVRGEFYLKRNTALPWNFYVHVKIFDATNQLLTDIPAKLNRVEKHYRSDPQLNASFVAKTEMPLAHAARIEVSFDGY